MSTLVLKGRKVVGGVSEGEALVTRDTISGWGGIDPRTGQPETAIGSTNFLGPYEAIAHQYVSNTNDVR